jgi:hypothetical protein
MSQAELPKEFAEPTDEEKTLLDQEMDDYQKNPQAESPWSEVEARLRSES